MLKTVTAMVTLATAACGSGFAHEEKLAGPYYLVAVDVMEDMSLCRMLANGDCSGDGLGGETVFAAGADSRFVTLATHPRSVQPEPADHRRNEYYYFLRTKGDAWDGIHSPQLRGPFNEQQFAGEKRRFGLPEFSRVFEQLR